MFPRGNHIFSPPAKRMANVDPKHPFLRYDRDPPSFFSSESYKFFIGFPRNILAISLHGASPSPFELFRTFLAHSIEGYSKVSPSQASAG